MLLLLQLCARDDVIASLIRTFHRGEFGERARRFHRVHCVEAVAVLRQGPHFLPGE